MMKKALMLGSGLAVVLALTPGASSAQSKAPAAPEKMVYDAASAMEYFKGLSGDWQAGALGHEHGSSPASSYGNSLSFKTKANGSAVVQTSGAGTKNEMETIFHMDGDKLLLTHYCALQNAPVLRFEKTNKPGEIKFVFDGGTNFDPKVDAHFHEGTFQVKDKDTLEQHFTVFSNGQATPEGHTLLKRKQTSSSQ
ncbi:MAG: hypothetical protein DMF90_11475 [Acidobacteria bacterium]|nr:MAG: hypothetical protein DMF90_11475 [Acidobacteriota bacterium]